jgi:hypothetical protein
MNLPGQITTYFTQLFTELIAIGHTSAKPKFFQSKYAVPENGVPPAFVYMENSSGNLAGNNFESIKNQHNLVFVVLFFHNEKPSEEANAINNAFKVMRSTVSRMVQDRNIQTEDGERILQFFSTDSITWNEERRVFDGFSGIRFTATIYTTFDEYIEETEWINTTTSND